MKKILTLLTILIISVSNSQTVVNWVGYPNNSTSWNYGTNAQITTSKTGGGEYSIQNTSSPAYRSLVMTGITNGDVAQNCGFYSGGGLRLEMSGAGNGLGTGVWDNSITVTITFPQLVCAPVTFNIYDITQTYYTNTDVYYQDKVEVSAVGFGVGNILPTVTTTGNVWNNVVGTTRTLIGKGTYGGSVGAPCQNQLISIGTAGQKINSITIVYKNQDLPTNNLGATVNRFGVSQYQYIFISNINAACLTTLPIELLSIGGENSDRENKITWVTASERNNDFFTIERSTDMINWIEVQKVDGSGTTISGNMYEITDYSYDNTTNYYRLSQTDFDGTVSVFENDIVSIDNKLEKLKVVRVINTMGQEVDENYSGVVILIYEDGSTEKSVQ